MFFTPQQIEEAQILAGSGDDLALVAYQMGLDKGGSNANTRQVLAAAQSQRLTEINTSQGAHHSTLFKAAQDEHDLALNQTANQAKHDYTHYKP